MFLTCDGRRWRTAFGDVCLKFTLAILVLVVIALCILPWSTGTATVASSAGEVKIGLWKACANVPNERIFSNNENGRDCRYGHCIGSNFLTPRTRAGAHDLCGSSKATAAFGLLSVVCCIGIMYNIVYLPLTGADKAHGWASFFAISLALCTLLSWAVWVGWQAKFNDDPNRTSDISTLHFSSLKLNIAPVLVIIAFVLALVNAVLQVLHFIEAVKREAQLKAQRSSRVTQNESFEETMVDLRQSAEDVVQSSA